MNSVYTSRRRLGSSRLMIIESKDISRGLNFDLFANLENYLRPGDLLVMNTSGTVPGSFQVSVDDFNFELRLASFAGTHSKDLSTWWAVSFGAGTWRQPTEERGKAPTLRAGAILRVNALLHFQVTEVHPQHHRLLKIRACDSDNRSTDALFRAGSPIQYSYHRDELKIWDIQTPLAQVPISVEPPSALFPFSWDHLLRLARQWKVAHLLHGAGLSSTGDENLDGLLPLPEYFEIPDETIGLIQHTKNHRGRVIAVGTTVARALESAFSDSSVQQRGVTKLKLSSKTDLKVIDGLITGFHELKSSHFELESAFAHPRNLADAYVAAKEKNFIGHEFGDAVLLTAS